MIFEILLNAAEYGELILVDGGLCHWHLRKDGQVTIHEIIVLPSHRGRGIASSMLERLKHISGATSIFAKCPADLPANGWYRRMGFIWEGEEQTRSGRWINRWRFQL